VHTIRIQLPVPVELNITLENETAPCDAICVRLRRIVEGTQNLISTMQSSITEMTQRRPLAQKIFSFESQTSTSYSWSIDIFCLNLTVFE
jgi:hypothetical protein